MDFSKLSQNEKLAVYGAIASVIGPILATAGFGFGVGIFTLLLALAMLAIVFLPQWSPQSTLPGSKGSLMVLVGGVAAVSAALALIGSIGYLSLFGSNVLFVLGWLVGIAGGLLMGWAGWQEFQAEGGKFQLGTPASSSSAAPAASNAEPAPVTPAPAVPPADASAAPPAPTSAAPPPSDPEQRPPA